jgi:hypothetical protein
MSDAPMVVHLYDDRRMQISPWSIGNSKIGSGPGVYTYSRLPGPTCPGATEWCIANCYAKRVDGAVEELWTLNGERYLRAPLPDDATLVRIHVSGDFDTTDYIAEWIDLALERPEVRFFGYTRSWRISGLYSMLVALRDLPNVQLFASVDPGDDQDDIDTLRLDGWRLSLIEENETDAVATATGIMCPEQDGRAASCDDCGFCWKGQRMDVTFRAH